MKGHWGKRPGTAALPATPGDAHQQIFDYIARFYNTQRLHSSLGYLSPAQFEQQS